MNADKKSNKDEQKNKKNTDSYTGGTSSGLAVENPEEEGKDGKFSGNYNNLIDKAKKYVNFLISARKLTKRIWKISKKLKLRFIKMVFNLMTVLSDR